MNRKVLFLVIAVVVAAVLGGAAVTVLRKPAPAAAPAVKPAKVYKSVELDEFIVNLADVTEQHYLKTTIVLEVEEGPEVEQQIEKLSPKIRDAMITSMSRNRFRALLTPQGKSALKKNLKKAVNNELGEPVVHEIFFTSFAMQ